MQSWRSADPFGGQPREEFNRYFKTGSSGGYAVVALAS